MSLSDSHEFTKRAWNANARVWDDRMGTEGNDFFKQLQYPFILDYLGVKNGQFPSPMKILDVSCGNGVLSRKLAALGAEVIGIDFSEALIQLAENYPDRPSNLQYYITDVTEQDQLTPWMDGSFDAVVCNMALFDISDIEPLIMSIPKILRSGGIFIFSILHPSFNNSSTIKMLEEIDEGELKHKYSLKIDKYLSIYERKGVALREQQAPQIYFNRPLQYYLKLCFEQGFKMDRFDEPALIRAEGGSALSWGSNFAEIPPVLLARMVLPTE